MNEQKNGIGFIGMLQLLFIGLKLTGSIDWGWLWVLAPVWIPIIMILIIILILQTIKVFRNGK